MAKNSKIQELLDAYLKFKQDKPGSDITQFWTKLKIQNTSQADIEVSKDIFELFSEINVSESNLNHDDGFEALNNKIEFADKTAIQVSNQKKWAALWLRIAAVFIPIALITSFFIVSLTSKASPDQLTASTLKGSKTTLILEDGTKVWLNAESELKFPSSFKKSDKRTVRLTGEAFFEVTKNKKKPFEVYIKGYKVNVLGTSFNVKAYPNDNKIEATLEHGKVNIEKLLGVNNEKSKKVVSLKPNQTIVIYDSTKTAIIDSHEILKKSEDTTLLKKKPIEEKALLIETDDLSPYISWKDNELIFKNEPLHEIVSDLERWYNIKIEITDEELKDIKFTATFTTETVEQAIYAMCTASKIDYEINKNTVILKTDK